jgi:hypothetical protein
MSTITSHQLAEVLLGIARAQQAIIEAMENSKAGFKSTHFRPAVETAARIKANRSEALVDFPSRLLLQMLGRTGPDIDQVVRDLERLLGEPKPASAEGAPAPAGSSA